ncbi:MAG: PIG-L family deacetylase, partial [Candidatus Latescibacteria bacterium]|nr:PIG-L family deacetylase [Candidatus Latescibacterota bacterium]
MSPALQRAPIQNPKSKIQNFFLAAVLCLLLPAPSLAGRPASDRRGTTGLVQALQKLPVVVSLLNIGAHPDDENSGLLAYTSRGLMARTAYLSVDRGEGGQNLIGPELYDGIGIIRTEELLAARQLDGAEQFFTRAYDFGFSKQASEAMELWGHEETLADIVRVIRMFRPDVIVSVFAGAPEDGHGQHQAAGLLAREAFRAAADPNRFPDQIAAGLRPWQAKKLYINNTRASFPSLATLRVNVGEYSPVLGRSYLEVGLESRSMHRSQDMGAVQRKGPAWTELKLVETIPPMQDTRIMDGTGVRIPQIAPRWPTLADSSLFDGLDTTIMRLARIVEQDSLWAPFLRPDLTQIDRAARDALAAYRPSDPTVVLPVTLDGLTV